MPVAEEHPYPMQILGAPQHQQAEKKEPRGKRKLITKRDLLKIEIIPSKRRLLCHRKQKKPGSSEQKSQHPHRSKQRERRNNRIRRVSLRASPPAPILGGDIFFKIIQAKDGSIDHSNRRRLAIRRTKSFLTMLT